MSTKITIKHLGILQQADFSLGDLTIICGKNNTGKTYATYALYGFLKNWKELLSVGGYTQAISVLGKDIETLQKDGVVHIDLTLFSNQMESILIDACKEYSSSLAEIFASKENLFKATTFQVQVDIDTESRLKDTHSEIKFGFGNKRQQLALSKPKGENELVVSWLNGEGRTKISNQLLNQIIRRHIFEHIVALLFEESFPSVFIASDERTGAAIFRKELDFARNRLLKEISRSDRNIDPRELLFKNYQDYPLPVEDNVDFIRNLERNTKKNSFLANEHPELLNDFADMIGGEYLAGSNDTIYFKPSGQQLSFAMSESSSAVRSLLDIGFYLNHVARRGDMLMVDEPELNLHPANQRRIARLLARLINVGIKVFITTHSDYIVKELNTLIMLNQDKPHLKKIVKDKGYQNEELLSPNQVKVYIAQEIPRSSKKGPVKAGCTLMPADINAERGIEVRSFDDTIDEMNEILEEIMWDAE